MGYRSDVQAVIYGPSDEVLRFVTATKLEDKYKVAWQEFESYKQIKIFTLGKTADGTYMTAVHLCCNDVKWYPDFEDVKAWDALMHDAEQEYNLQYEFIRVGEEDGDVEREQSADCDWLLSTSRPTIYLDVNQSMTTEGFPNETDSDSTGQE